MIYDIYKYIKDHNVERLYKKEDELNVPCSY